MDRKTAETYAALMAVASMAAPYTITPMSGMGRMMRRMCRGNKYHGKDSPYADLKRPGYSTKRISGKSRNTRCDLCGLKMKRCECTVAKREAAALDHAGGEGEGT